jgi:release factor glutamine methyltransferase
MQRDGVAAVQAAIRNRLRGAGISSAQLDARLIVQHAMQLSHERLIAEPQRALTAVESRSIEMLTERRMAREPVSRIVGEREFYGRMFGVNTDTLDPRPDTETLVEAALAIVRLQSSSGKGWRIADLGTGSGVVIITLLAELPEAAGAASEISRGALAMARENALRHKVASRLALIRCSWLAGLQDGFDLIVANPPYIPTASLAELPPEVGCYDPVLALDGGADGLEAYRRIGKGIGRHLRVGGHLCLEIGRGQEGAVSKIMVDCGLRPACKVPPLTPDISRITRVVTFESS